MSCGYQKGKCFYCSADISVEAGHEDLCDVDHFFPHTLGRFLPADKVNLDGVWNLVLSCWRCNRGKQGKSARVPAIRFLQKLHRRNEYLIGSHHPLRETLMTQTGRTESERRSFLQEMESFAMQHLVSRWEPADELKAVI
jgi:CRISPR/Cas system Type II protein with McrA/HNH and RuvC-like nuclease domain